MRLLLINKNPVVSRMMQMSVPKAGFDIEECDNVYDLPTGTYEVVVIDDEMYDENFMHDIKQHVKFRQLGLISASHTAASDEFDFVLTKPFLPTDLIEVLRTVKTKIEEAPAQQEEKEPFEELLDEKSEPFGEFMKEESEESLEHFAQAASQAPLGESIVEVEESVEESPFVEKIEEPGDVLDKSELEKVSELLQETEEKDELDDILAHAPKIEPISLIDDERTSDIERTPQPISLLDENEEFGTKEPESDVIEELTAPAEEEEESEEILDKLVEPAEESQENVATQSQEREPELEEPQAPTAPTPEESIAQIRAATNEEAKKITVEDVLKNLSIEDLRKLLDGAKIDITITISYPEDRDV